MNDAWSIPLSSPFPPDKLVGEGTFLSLRKKKEEKIKIWSLTARYCLPGSRCCTKCQITYAKNRKHEIDKMCGAYELYLCTGSAPGFVQRITCNSGKTCTKGGCRNGVPATAPYGKNLRRCSMFQELLTGCHLRSQGGQHQAL